MFKRIIKIFWFGSIFILLPLSAYSQPKRLQFRHITPDDGLSSASVSCLLQDYQGFMWIGTYDGLNRYDGNKFMWYKSNPSIAQSLPNSIIRSMHETHNKELYIGTQKGLCKYNREMNNFVNFVIEDDSPLYERPFAVYDMLEDDSGNLWLATDDGLIYFEISENKITEYTHESDNENSLSHNSLERLWMDKRNRLWITSRRGLNIYYPGKNIFKRISKTNKGKDISEVFFLDVVEDKKGHVWIASQEGLFCCKETGSDSVIVTLYSHDPKDKHSVSSNSIKTFYIDNEGNLWIGTENAGIDLYDYENDRFWHYSKDIYNPASINNESIESILRDNSGNLWVGTYQGGLNVAPKYGGAIVTYNSLSAAPKGLNHNAIMNFLEDHKGRIWIATDGGGINLFHKELNQFSHFTTDNTAITSNAIITIYEDTYGTIWLGTWAGGLIGCDFDHNRFQVYTKSNSDIKDNNIYAIAEDDDQNLWLGTFENGLICFNRIQNTFEQYNIQNSALTNSMIMIIDKDSRGNLYLGCPDMFFIFDPRQKSFKGYDHDPNNSNSLCHNAVRDIFIQNDTTVWIGTFEGLSKFNPITERFTNYTSKEGLPGNVINGIEEDNEGMLWITTNKGICRTDVNLNEFKYFTRDDGLQGDKFRAQGILKLSSGEILMGGTNGFTMITPDRIGENKRIPEILITDLYIFNKPVKIGEPDSPLEKQISLLDEIKLSHRQSVLTFHFTALDFTSPQKNRFKYKLENFDKDWINAGNKREATYTNLDPGEYVFCVIGSNNDGVWNNEGARLKIIILPLWYETMFFKVAIILMVIGMAFAFYLYRINLLKKQKILLERIVEERTSEIKEKNRVLSDQTQKLNETNVLLEERQQRIEEQNEMLVKQTSELNETNTQLEERQQFIEEQAEELRVTARELHIRNEELHVLNATKDRLFSIIAHDLKNPFNAIMGFSEMLANKFDTFDEAKKKRLIKGVYKSSVMVYRLLENLLQWSRSQTGNFHFVPTNINLQELVESNLLLFENMAKEKNNSIKNHINGNIQLFADVNMINTVIRNLITNAIKFTENGKIDITASEDKNKVKVEISDTGIGMTKEECDKLFFIDQMKTTKGTRGEPGTGLGLIICKEFIQKHRGTIDVESSPGEGTTFHFILPHPG